MEQISAVLLTGILAILGTVIGNVVKGYWSNRLATKDFQSKLILKAMESEDSKVRAKSLEFLTKVNLIDDPKIKAGVREVLDSGELELIPQFRAAGVVETGKMGVTEMQSAKGQLFEKENIADSKAHFLALTGFLVQSGDIIDGLTPIFSEIRRADGQFIGKHLGKPFGGTGGGSVELYREGYLVTGIHLIRGLYFGREEVVHFQLNWQRLTAQGLDASDEILSDKLGSGAHVTFAQGIPSRVFRAKPQHYITDFSAQQSYRSDGSTFLHDMTIQEKALTH